MKETFSKRDYIFIATLVIICLLSFIIIYGFKENGGFAVVTIAGKEVGIYDLGVNNEYTFGDIDENTIVIEDGYVYMKSASCPDGLCIKQGKKHKKGETIVCLPHKLIVEVVKGEENEFDSISGGM